MAKKITEIWADDDIVRDIEQAEVVKVEPRPRQISEDKGNGQINVTLAEGEADKFVQLRLNGQTVDSKKSVNGFVQLRFLKGWPTGDFQYKVV